MVGKRSSWVGLMCECLVGQLILTDGHSGFGRSGFGRSGLRIQGLGHSRLNPERPNLDICGFRTLRVEP